MEKRYTGFVDVKCAECGRMFITRAAEVKRGYGRFCSRSCASIYGNRERSPHGTDKVTLSCDYCGVEFERLPSACNKAKKNKHENSYCSKVCAINGTGLRKREKHKALAENKDCPYCGEEFSTYNKPKEQVFCSVTCARASRRGENYGKNGWLSKRFKILHRDGFRCVYCGKSTRDGDEVRLEIDHIVPRAAGGSNGIDNLVTACWECNNGKRDKLYEIYMGEMDIAGVGNPH